MALITCSDCLRSVSSDAPSCLHCGARIDGAAAIRRKEILTDAQRDWDNRRFMAKVWFFSGWALLMLMWLAGISISDGFVGYAGLAAVVVLMGYGAVLRFKISESRPSHHQLFGDG